MKIMFCPYCGNRMEYVNEDYDEYYSPPYWECMVCGCCVTKGREGELMKLYNIYDIEGLFEVINKCKGRVELVSDDIRLNLKSKLAQYFSLANLFSGGEEIPELEIIAYEPEDKSLLLKYMIG